MKKISIIGIGRRGLIMLRNISYLKNPFKEYFNLIAIFSETPTESNISNFINVNKNEKDNFFDKNLLNKYTIGSDLTRV